MFPLLVKKQNILYNVDKIMISILPILSDVPPQIGVVSVFLTHNNGGALCARVKGSKHQVRGGLDR